VNYPGGDIIVIIRPDMPRTYAIVRAQALAVEPENDRICWYAARPSDQTPQAPAPRSQGVIDFFGLFLHRALAASHPEPRH
jgi:hypothetical protein